MKEKLRLVTGRLSRDKKANIMSTTFALATVKWVARLRNGTRPSDRTQNRLL